MSENNAEIRIYRRLADPFARVPKALLADTRLSWKAKGIAAYLLGKPLNWRVRIPDLMTQSRDGRDAIYAGIKELREAGYMAKHVNRREGGVIIGVEYRIADYPAFADDKLLPANPEVVLQLPAFPEPVQPDTALPFPGNPPLNKKEEDSKKEHQQEGPGYDEEEDDGRFAPPGVSMDFLKKTLCPIFNLKPHYHPSALEESYLVANDGKFQEWEIASLVRWLKLSPDSKVAGIRLRKQSFRTLMEVLGEQVALATKVYPENKAAKAAAAVPVPEAVPTVSSEDRQRRHEQIYRDKVRAGLIPGVPREKADDPDLEIPPLPA